MQCSIPSCKTKAFSRNWCHKHYERWRHYGDPNTKFRGGPKRPRLESEIRPMPNFDAAQVGRMIDTDGWIMIRQRERARDAAFTAAAGFYAYRLPQLAHDLQQLTGAGTVRPYRGGQLWQISRFLSVLALVQQTAPWSYKAQEVLPKLQEILDSADRSAKDRCQLKNCKQHH